MRCTVRFLRMFDQIFALLNSRNPLCKGSKAPLSRANAEKWAQMINDAESYIVGLKDIKGVLLMQSKRKTAFVGFLVCVRSARNIFDDFVGPTLQCDTCSRTNSAKTTSRSPRRCVREAGSTTTPCRYSFRLHTSAFSCGTASGPREIASRETTHAY